AVVNIQAAILESDYGQEELAKLENREEYAELVSESQSLIADVQALDSDAQANGNNWNQEQLSEYNRQRQFLTEDLQVNNQRIQSEREAVVRRINQAMNQRALTALQELIEEEGVTLLLQESAVYHATEEHNITSQLAAKLNSQ
ncbi:MAG: OmpH family outer membrane protein, partial [Pseudomonadales bacterium]